MRGSTTLKTVFGISLFANLMWLADSSTRLFSAISSMPSSIATILTGLGGLGMIAWQTNRGFRNLIRSQVHRSRIERRAREHQAVLDQRKRDAESREAKLTLAALLQAELVMILQTARIYLKAEQDQIEIVREYTQQSPYGKINIGLISAPIFSNKISDIGILGASLSTDILRAYQIIEMNKLVEDGTFAAAFETAVDVRKKYFNSYIPFLEHAIKRLHAFHTGQPDPGDFYYATVRVKAAQ